MKDVDKRHRPDNMRKRRKQFTIFLIAGEKKKVTVRSFIFSRLTALTRVAR